MARRANEHIYRHGTKKIIDIHYASDEDLHNERSHILCQIQLIMLYQQKGKYRGNAVGRAQSTLVMLRSQLKELTL